MLSNILDLKIEILLSNFQSNWGCWFKSQTLSANLGPWAKLGDLGTLPILKTIFQRYFETQSHSRTTASLGAI